MCLVDFPKKPINTHALINGAQNDLFPGECACAYFRHRENTHAENPPQRLRYVFLKYLLTLGIFLTDIKN
jgi:hypothetical protein